MALQPRAAWWTAGGPQSLQRMRARALAPRTHVTELALGAVAALVSGFLIGRWWKRKQLASANTYVHGTDVLSAP